MLARIAHELFWLGRNVSRAELTARMIDGVFQADLQGRPDDPSGVTLSWDAVLAIMGSTATADSGRPSRAETVVLLSTDPANANSVVASLQRARDGARAVRDVISAEMWEAINSVHLGLADAAVGVTGYGGPYSFVSYVKSRTALFWGVASRTMLRDEAYAFLDAGGRFESADMVLRMLRVALPPHGEREAASPRDGQALALLGAVGGLQAFRRARVAAPSAPAVASFLLYTRSYPDSVAASIDAVRHALELADANPRASDPVLRLSRVLADLDFRGRVGRRDGTELLDVCEIVGNELALADRDISERYFGGVAVPSRAA
jgi:uncharacterized alpha-E superfamily protein